MQINMIKEGFKRRLPDQGERFPRLYAYVLKDGGWAADINILSERIRCCPANEFEKT